MIAIYFCVIIKIIVIVIVIVIIIVIVIVIVIIIITCRAAGLSMITCGDLVIIKTYN